MVLKRTHMHKFFEVEIFARFPGKIYLILNCIKSQEKNNGFKRYSADDKQEKESFKMMKMRKMK